MIVAVSLCYIKALGARDDRRPLKHSLYPQKSFSTLRHTKMQFIIKVLAVALAALATQAAATPVEAKRVFEHFYM